MGDNLVILEFVEKSKSKPPPSHWVNAGIYLLEGVFQAVTTFNQLGFKVLVVTNQPRAAKGKMSLARIDEINQPPFCREKVAPLYRTIKA